MIKKPDSPCLGCTDRWVTAESRCHSTCERYSKYEKLLDEYKVVFEQARADKTFILMKDKLSEHSQRIIKKG